MSKFFKSLLLLLSAGLFTATGWAADPVATWTDFNTLTSGDYTLTENGNTISDGVLTIGSKPSYIAGTTTWNPRATGNAVVLAMRVTNLDLTKVSALVSLKLGSTDNQLGLMTDGEGGMDAMWAGSIRGGNNAVSTKLSTTATEYIIVFKYDNSGTYAWAIGNDGVFANYTKDTACKGGTDEAGADIRIGALYGAGSPATGLQIHSMTLWNTNEAIEDVIAACATEEMKTNRAFVENGTGAEYTAAVAEDVNLSEIVWTKVADTTTVATADLPNGAKLKIDASNNPVITNDAAFANKLIYTANPLTVTAAITPNQNDYSAIIPGIVSNPSYEIFPAGLFVGPGAVTYTATLNASAGYEVVVAGNRATLKTLDSATVGIPSFGVNFYNNDAAKVAGTEVQGAYPIKGAAWTDVQGQSSTAVTSFNLADAAGNITENTTMSLERTQGARQYGLNNMPSSALLKGYIDDSNGNPTTLTFSNIPYTQYRVIVYMSTDTANYTFAPVSIGGTSYASVASNAATATVASSSNWGHSGPSHNANDLAEGVNYLVSPMMTDSSCVISTVRTNSGPRATIAAVQFIDCTAANRTMTLPGQEITLDANTNISDIDLTATEVLITVKPGVTLTFDAAVTLDSLRVVAEGTAESPVKFDATVANPFENIGSVTLEGTAVELVADIYSDTKPSKTALEVIAIASNATATAETPQEVASTIAIASGKTLKTKGYLNFTAANTIAGTLEVVSGVTTFNLAERGLTGTLKVAAGATFKNGTQDGPDWGGAPTLDIAGTLEVTGTARWSLSKNTTTTLREGAVLKGAGGTGYNYAFDWFDGATINVLGDATIEGNIGAHNGNNDNVIVFNVSNGTTVTLSGKYDGGVYSNSYSAKLKATGTGTLKLTGANTYTGGTTIETGAKIEVANASALPGAIANDGTITYTIDATPTNTLSGAGVTGVDAATLNMLSANLDGYTGSFAVANNGTLILPAGKEEGVTVAAGSTLRLNLTDEQLKDPYSTSATIDGGTIVYTKNAGAEEVTEGVEGGTYTPATVAVYTVADGTWSIDPFANAPVEIDFGDTTGQSVNLAEILGEVTAIKSLTVTGTNGGTITKTGAGAVTVTTATTVNTNVTFGNGALPQGAIAIAEEKTLTLSAGTNEAYEGTITVATGATLHLPYGAGLTNPASSIVLEEGATILAQNGAGTSSTIASAITLNGAATIQGSIYGNDTNFSGVITGTGSLTIKKDPGASNPITFTGANTYAGGTTIAEGATLTITNADAIGTGAITGAGTLVCNGFMPANMTGLTDAENWTGTLALVSTPEQADIAFNSLGNASSTVRLQDYTGSLSNKTAATCYTPNLEIKGTNAINAATEYAIPIFQGDVSGDGTIVFSANKNTNYLFSGDFSEFTGTMELTHTSPKIAIGAASNTTWNAWNPIVNNGQGNITIATAATLNGTFRAVNGVETTSSAILSGNGTIDSALTLTANATIDASATLLTVTGAVTLPDALTVKIAAAPAVGTAVSLLNAANVTIPEGMTVNVMVGGEADATNTYQLVATATALLLENVPAEDVVIEASNIAAAQSYASSQQGNYDTYGVQVDLDGIAPYAPGWVSGVYYPLTSFAVVGDATGRVAVGTCVQVVDVDNPSNVVATSAPFQNENMESVSVVCSDVTKNYYRYTFKFEAPVYVDAAKTYQFRFVNGEGAAVTCKLRALYTSDANGGGDNQRYCNWLNNQYEVINSGAVTPRYMPYVELTAERIVDNSPVLSGGDETLVVDAVPEKIRLNTATFGYGTHTVLQYTGGTTDWAGMSVEGLPDGAEIITTDTTWGFAIKTLNVLTVGDSITAGLVTYHNSSANWHVPGGYRLPLYKYLTRAGYTVKYLGASDEFGTYSGGNNPSEANPSPSLGENDHHEGHSGTTLDEAYSRFGQATAQQVIASQGTPDVITLHLGTNDMQNQAQNTDDSVGNQFAEMKKLIYRLNGVCDTSATDDWKAEIGTPLYPNAKIIVAKIIPRGDSDNQSKVEKFNLLLTQYVDYCDSNNLVLVTLPMGEGTSYGYYRHDYLHPSTEGYAQMAKGWFDAIDAAFDPFGETTAAPTPVDSTPTTDVTEEDPETIGIRNSTAKTIGPFKAAEWTTFAGFETGYISQFGYMPDAERPWQLDVRGENAPTVTDGVLSLNGAPITVNPVDGRLGTTLSTYTIVMKVSDLAENDVIFTDSSVECTDWPSAKGTTNADLGKLTVVDADILQWTYNGLENGPTIDLTGANLTDTTPDVIAITVANNQCKVAVNGGTPVTVTQGSAIDETYRGSWSIGALSTADTGSSMKLYRLSFYEGAATVTMPATEYVIPVGTYDTWSEAVAGLNITDTTLPVTINFTAVDQTFTFDNADAVELTQVIIAGTAGGKLAKTGEAVTTASLTVNTSTTLTDGAVEATDTVTIAEDCVLTYNQTKFTSELTTTATYTGNGELNLTGSGLLELTKPCNVDVAVSGGASLCVNVPTTDAQKAFADRVNVTTTAEALLELKQGLSFCEINAAGMVQVTGAYTLGIGGDGAGSFAADILYVIEGATLTTRAWRAYELTATSAIWVDGTIANDPQGSVSPTVKVVSGSTLSTYRAAGTLELDVTIAEGGLIEAGDLTVNGSITYPDTLKVALAELPTDENFVKVLNTTAFADATGYDWETEVTVIFNQETFVGQYLLYKTETSLELRPLMEVTEATASGEVDRWSEVLNQLSAEGKRLATSGATLTIDFGDADGEAVPGTFTFDLDDESVLTLAAVQIQGTNGGTIAKEGEGVSISVGATSIAENVAVDVTAGAMELGTTTIAAGAEVTLNDTAALGTTDAASVANKVTGAGTLVLNGALPAGLANGSAGKLVAEDWTGTVKVVNVDNRNLDLGDLVRPDSSLVLNNVKAYIYDCAMALLTLEGDFQQNNGTSERPKTQCVTINTLTGSGALIGPNNAPYCTAYNVKAVENFTGAIDLSHENSKNTIFFFGVAPERFTTSITEGNVGANDADFTDEDYGTLYTNIALTVPAGKTWAVKGVVVEAGGSLAIEGWCDPGSRLVQNNPGAATVENGGVLDLRGLDNLSGISVTVKDGGRVLVKSGATVPDTIVFESEDAILGICPASVDDIGSATLTVTASGTAKSTATKKGYKTDGVTELGNWADKGAQGDTLSFGYDPIFDGELCWWAYEFDEDENTTTDSTDGPDNTGRDKTSLAFDGSGSTGRILVGQEYVTNGDGTKALRLAAAPHRGVDPSYPEAFTATVYGKLTSQLKTILLGFGSTYDSKDTIALVTGASPNEVNLVWVKGHEGDNGDYPENCVTTLATTTVPNGTTENHLFGFSYELKDTDEDGTKDTTEIIFYVDGEKYQPYKVKEIIALGDGFQAGSLHGGWPRNGKAPTESDWLYRMGDNDADKAATIEFLRVYDEVLPEATFTAMANAYPYISKVGRATRTITGTTNDTTWHEAGEWSQVKVVDGVEQDPVDQNNPDFGTTAEPEIGTQVFLNVDGANTLYLNEFYSTTTNPETTIGNSKLYYERLEINGVEGGAENDSLTMWAGRLNPAIEEEDPLKNSQSAVLTVLGYTKINTNVTFAHNVAYLSGPVAVAEGKYLHFDFSGFDVMKVPSMPVTYRLTGFLDEETRPRVTSTAPADPVNARSVDLGYKTDVNQYTFTVNRYPVTAYFTADDDPMMAAFANNPAIDFNTLSYIWQGNELGKTMNWDAEAVDPQGNPIVENTLAKFVSLDAETQQEKIVTVSLATTDADPITLTLAESALSKETAPAVVEPMLGAEQLIVGNNVIVNYTGEAATLARTLNEASAETTGVIRTAGFTVDAENGWRANLSVTGGALAGVGTISGKVTFETGTTLDASAATAEACLSAKDADLTNLKDIKVNYDAAAGKTLKVLDLPEGHTAKSLIGCTVTAVDGEGNTVATWTETGATATLVVVRADGLYVTGRPVVKAGETVIATNDDLTLPLARRAAELSATSVNLTGVVNMAGEEVDASVADAAEVFTNVAFDMTKTPDANGAVEAKLKYDFGVSDIAVVTSDSVQYVVAELIVSNHSDINQNTAGYADGTTIDVTVKVGDAVQDVTVEAAADMTGATVAPAAELPASTRYIRFLMPEGNGTFEIKARASKSAQP